MSGGLFYEDHIGKILRNEKPTQFTGILSRDGSLAPLRPGETLYPRSPTISGSVDVRRFLQSEYDAVFLRQVYDLSTSITTQDLQALVNSDTYALLRLPAYTGNRNLDARSTLDAAFHPDYQDVSSPYFCGRSCLRRYRIEYKLHPGWDKVGLGQMVSILTEWKLMEDIREDAARMSYYGAVPFKVPLRQPMLHSTNSGNFEEKYVMVYIARDVRPTMQRG